MLRGLGWKLVNAILYRIRIQCIVGIVVNPINKIIFKYLAVEWKNILYEIALSDKTELFRGGKMDLNYTNKYRFVIWKNQPVSGILE